MKGAKRKKRRRYKKRFFIGRRMTALADKGQAVFSMPKHRKKELEWPTLDLGAEVMFYYI